MCIRDRLIPLVREDQYNIYRSNTILERQDTYMKFYAGLDVGGTSGRVKFSTEDKTLIGEYLRCV